MAILCFVAKKAASAAQHILKVDFTFSDIYWQHGCNCLLFFFTSLERGQGQDQTHPLLALHHQFLPLEVGPLLRQLHQLEAVN
jgi:hypothetical protein